VTNTGDGPPRSEDEEKWPVGFMIIVGLVVLYLGWRVIQGIGWLVDKL